MTISRRNFGKAAVALGGTTALTACLRGNDIAKGGGDLPDRQHAWNEYLPTDSHGNTAMPKHHVLLHLDYSGDSTEDDRTDVEAAFSSLERAYEWSNEGLLFTVGYSPYYFRTMGHQNLGPPEPQALSPHQSPDRDTADALLHLASDYPGAVVEAEEALFGEIQEPNGESMEADLEVVFEKKERRTGFVGPGLPAQNQDVRGVPDTSPVPEDSPLFMGFKGRFKRNQPSEDHVTIKNGRFSGGTTQQVSWLELRLERWYRQDSRYQRVAKMFCPAHADEERVEGVGENLGDSSGVSGCPVPHDSAREKGVVGHAQKTSRERTDGVPPLLRRDFSSTDGGNASLYFNSLQESIDDFVRVRKAMNAEDIAEDTPVGEVSNNGILSYIRVRSRGNYLIPPRKMRSLPASQISN